MAYCAYCGSHVAQVSFAPCASCGNPTNGAPARPRGSSPTNPALIVILVIVGGLFVVAIVGILAAIAIPNLITAMERSRQKRTLVEMRAIASSLEAHANDKGSYPDNLSPRMDGWTHELKYEKKDGVYFLGSGGKDRMFERDSLSEYPQGTTSNFDCDIVLSNGQFVQMPEGLGGGGQ